MFICVSVFINLFLIIAVFWILVAMFFKKEIDAIFERDPAAKSFLEVLLTYSGLHALVFHRISSTLLKFKVPSSLTRY